MHSRRLLTFVLMTLTLLLCSVGVMYPHEAHALSLLEEEEMTFKLGAFARTRLGATSTDGATLEPGADVIMARLIANADFKGLGHALIIVETIKQPSVFDAFIDINLGSPVGLTLGLMRMPLSREMLINIPVISVYDRAWLSSTLAPRRRTGALLHGAWTFGGVTILSQFGAFNPTSATRAGEDGLLLLGAIDLTHTSHFNLHIAGMTHTLEPNASTLPPEVVYPRGQQLDVALFYNGDHLRVLAEALLVKPEDGDVADLPLGLHAFVAYRFTPSTHRFAYEPALSGDYVVLPDGSDMERVTANMHWLLRGRNVQASMGYGWESREVTTHRLLTELQVMF